MCIIELLYQHYINTGNCLKTNYSQVSTVLSYDTAVSRDITFFCFSMRTEPGAVNTSSQRRATALLIHELFNQVPGTGTPDKYCCDVYGLQEILMLSI